MKNTLKTIMGAALVTSMVMSCPVAAKAKKGKIKSVKVSNLPAKTLTLKKGKSKTLKFKVTKSGKISKALAYKSSNKKIVTVSKKGKVTAKKKGKAKVTAYAKANKKKKVVITVTVGTPVSKIKLNKKKATLKVKKTLKLKATVTPKKASNKKVVWKTSNKKIATVKNGKVTAKKAGKATITAVAADGSGKKATAKITVKKAITVYNVASLTVNDPYDVKFALNKAQPLDVSQVTLQEKTTEDANYRNTLKIEKLTTTDNINYTAKLKASSAIENVHEDHNVRITVTGLKNNKAPSVLETLFNKGKINYTDDNYVTFSKNKGYRDLVVSYNDTKTSKYEVAGIPAEMKQDPNREDGVHLFGTPTQNADITVKETDVYGNVYTEVTHMRYYDDNTLTGYAEDAYVKQGIDTKGTDTIDDDTPAATTYASTSVNVFGGSTYQNEQDVETGTTHPEYIKDKNGNYEVKLDKGNPVYDKIVINYTVKTGKDETKSVTVDKADDYAKYFETDENDKLTTTDDDVKVDGNTLYGTDGEAVKQYVVDTTKLAKALSTDGKTVAAEDLSDVTTEYTPAYATQEVKDTKHLKYIETKYTVDNPNFTIYGESNSVTISGYIAGDTTVNVTATKKNSAGQDISVTIPVVFHYAPGTLVKGTITSNNNRVVNGGAVSFVDNDNNNNHYSNVYSDGEEADAQGTVNNLTYTRSYETGRYEAMLRTNTTYDADVYSGHFNTYYANQTPTTSMNYVLDATVYDVSRVNSTGDAGYDNYNLSGTYYDNDTNETYYVAQSGFDTYTVVSDGANHTAAVDNSYSSINKTLTLANGAATATITKK